jgi:hypothetical protein
MVRGGGWEAYVGLIEIIFLSSLLLTHSLLIKSPVGWVYFRPLGAVSSSDRSDILFDVLNSLRGCARSLMGDRGTGDGDGSKARGEC